MVRPTTENRIKVLDVLRGVAILGILLANIPAFSEPMTQMFSAALPPRNAGERLYDSLAMVLVNGKFRSMLAILFGFGLWLQFQKREKIEGAWPGGYIKRMAWLFVLGLIHGYLIWQGDILGIYAIVAVVAALFVRCSDKVLWWVIGSLAAFAALGSIINLAFVVLSASQPGGGAAPFDLSSMFEMMKPANEIAAFQRGTWLQQFGYRGILYSVVLISVLFMGFSLLPLFLTGVMFARRGFLQSPSSFSAMRKWCLIIGFGVGLPLNLVGLIPMEPKVAEGVQMGLMEILAGPLLAVGYITGLAILFERGALGAIGRVLGKVGRVALSAYVLQSLVCTFIFYSWGLGLFGKATPAIWLGAVGAAWTIDISFAYLWLAKFRMGPLEWLWRSLTEGKVLPIAKSASPAAEQPEAPAPPPVQAMDPVESPP